MKQHCYIVTDELKKYVRVCRNLLESITQRLSKDMKMHSNVRFSQLPKYLYTIDDLCSVCDIKDLECFKKGMGEVDSAYSWVTLYPNTDVYQLEDSGFTHGSLYAFDKDRDISDQLEAYRAFKSATDLQRARILVAFGYQGTDFGGCSHGRRKFFGNGERWDCIFRYKEESTNLKDSFTAFAEAYKAEKSIDRILKNRLESLNDKDVFAYYFLKYDAFANSTQRWCFDQKDSALDINGSHFFAIVNDYDIITLPRFNSSPLKGYHTDPYASAVAQYIRFNYPNVYSHMEYTGEGKHKAKITFKDKNIEIISSKAGWHICNLNQDVNKKQFDLSIATQQRLYTCYSRSDEDGQNYISIAGKDRIESGIQFIKLLYNLF